MAKIVTVDRKRELAQLALVAIVSTAMLLRVVIVRNDASAAGDGRSKSTALKSESSLVVSQPDGTMAVRPSSVVYTAADIEDAARRISEEVPFPPGLNSASHIDWARAIDAGIGGTSMSDPELRRIVQANAERDWAWHAARYELTEDEAQIVADVSQWSGRRPERPGVKRLTDRVLELGRSPEAQALTSRVYPDGRPMKSRW